MVNEVILVRRLTLNSFGIGDHQPLDFFVRAKLILRRVPDVENIVRISFAVLIDVKNNGLFGSHFHSSGLPRIQLL